MFGLYDMFSGQQPVADDDLRARRDAVHQRVDHPAAADGGLAVPRADLEGRRAGPAQDHAVHALPDARRWRSCSRSASPSGSSARRKIAGGLPLVYDPGWGFRLMCVLTLTTGTMFVMWLGEQITERGIGNGMSLLIFAGIVVGLPERGADDVRPDADRADQPAARRVPARDDGGRSSARSSSSSAATGASRCSTPSASSAAGSTAGRARTSR